MRLKNSSILFFFFILAGCGSTGSDTGGTGPAGLSVVVQATTASFTHQDDLAGQTARHVTAGIRSLTLIDEAGGGEFAVLDRDGASPVVVSYEDGASTVLTVVDPGAIVPGHYTRARMVQDWSKFEVDATLHEDVGATPGTLRALHVTSNGTSVDGQARDSGYYEHEFLASGRDENYTGDDAVVPEQSQTAGAEAIVENGVWAVYYPVNVDVSASDATLSIRVNMYQAFRWVDFPGAENQDGVFDMMPPLYEEVVQFGGNAFDVTYVTR